MKITTFCYSLIFLCAGFCCRKEVLRDPEVYNIEKENLIEIKDSRTSFNVNDTIWIKTEVSVLQEHENQNVNISEITGDSDRLYSYLGFYELTNFENPLEINLSEDELVHKTGDIAYNNSSLTATAYLQNCQFLSEFGIILKQPGEFIISSSYRPGAINLYVDTSNGTTVNISTTIKNSENPLEYHFVVE